MIGARPPTPFQTVLPTMTSDTTGTTLDILGQLVAFDTTSRNSNLPLIDWVEAYMQPFGGRIERIPSPDGEPKANLYMSFGPQDVPGYILSGHTDVVPVDGQDWTRPPFTLTVEGARAYGRGTCDMKGFLACCLAAAPQLAAAPLTTPIHLAFSYDEEIGCTGVRPMVALLGARNVVPKGAFIGEPSMMQVTIGHKGGQRYRVDIKGKAAHSSLAPHGVNAVEWGARLIAFIRDLADRTAAHGTRDALYDVPHTTLHCGIFHGGTANNIVPHEAWFTFEVRAIGSETAEPYINEIIAYAHEKLEPSMKAIDAAAGFTFTPAIGLPPLETAAEAEIAVLAKQLARRNEHGKVGYGTEASLFQAGGIPSVVVGPGNIEQAHKPDEFIEIAELARCNAFIDRLIAHCCR
jgi:acetylornithine deacetylase